MKCGKQAGEIPIGYPRLDLVAYAIRESFSEGDADNPLGQGRRGNSSFGDLGMGILQIDGERKAANIM